MILDLAMIKQLGEKNLNANYRFRLFHYTTKKLAFGIVWKEVWGM